MSFNDINKISRDELSPDLQAELDAKATALDVSVGFRDMLNSLQNEINLKADETALEAHENDGTKHITSDERNRWNATTSQLGSNVRVTVSTVAPINPQNNLELWYDTYTNLIKRYNNGWAVNNANSASVATLALNIPTSDQGGNFWIA